MTKAKAIAKNNPVDTATMEKFLAAKTHVGYKHNAAGAKIWYELDLAQIGDTKISKATAAELLKNGFGLTIDEYLAAQEQWVAQELARAAAEIAEDDRNEILSTPLVSQDAQEVAINAEIEQAKANLPTGTIEVATGAEAFALIAHYFPNGLTFSSTQKEFNYEDSFTFTDDSGLFAKATCTPDNSRVEVVEVINSDESGSKRHPLSVVIKPELANVTEVKAAIEDDEPKFEVGKTYYIMNGGKPFTLKVEARTAKMLTGTTINGTRKYHVHDTFRGEYVDTDLRDEFGNAEMIWAANEYKPVEVTAETDGSEDDNDYEETDEPEILNADLFVNLYHSPLAEQFSSTTRTINGEQLHFFHHRLTHISAPALNLEVYFDNGRMNFWHGSKRIARDKVWQVPIIKETAKAQTESFGKFFAGDHTSKFFKVSVYPTFADGSEHNYVRYFDYFNQAQKFVEEVKTFVGDVPTQVYITSGGQYLYTRINGIENYTLPAVDVTEAQSRLDDLNKAIADNESFADKCDEETASKLRVANYRNKRLIGYYETALRMTEPAIEETRPAFEDGKVYVLHARDIIGKPDPQLYKVKRIKMFGKKFLAIVPYIKYMKDFDSNAERYQIYTDDEGEYIQGVYSTDGCHCLYAKDITDDPTIVKPVDTQTNQPAEFMSKLAELKANADAAKAEEQKASDALAEAQKNYDKARNATCEANYAISRLYRAKANELKKELFALPKVKIELKTTCGEKFIASHTWGISTLGNKFSLLDMTHGACLATYDTPEQVTNVIERLKAAIARGNDKFSFATADAQPDKLRDSGRYQICSQALHDVKELIA